MDRTPNDEQTVFQTATADWCRDNMPLEAARARPAGLWQQLEAMGWTGMTAPGMDLDHATEALVFAELGRFLAPVALRSEEHTSELQSLMRISYAVFCLKKKKQLTK